MYGGDKQELSRCGKCFNILFIICNIPILLCGLTSLGIGIWQAIVDSGIEEVLSEVNAKIGASLFITSGILLTALSCLGFLGSCCKSRILLSIYFISILVIIALESASVGYAFAKVDDFDRKQVEMDLLSALRHYYPSNDTTNYDEDLNDAVDFVQENLECCGIVNGTRDWYVYSPYSKMLNRLPSSCCGRDEPEPCPLNEVYHENCGDAFSDFLQENLLVIGIIGIIFAVYEVLILVICCVLIIAIHKSFNKVSIVTSI